MAKTLNQFERLFPSLQQRGYSGQDFLSYLLPLHPLSSSTKGAPVLPRRGEEAYLRTVTGQSVPWHRRMHRAPTTALSFRSGHDDGRRHEMAPRAGTFRLKGRCLGNIGTRRRGRRRDGLCREHSKKDTTSEASGISGSFTKCGGYGVHALLEPLVPRSTIGPSFPPVRQLIVLSHCSS